MTTPIQDIEAILGREGCGCRDKRRQASILLAQAMLSELGSCVAEWEATLRSLQATEPRELETFPGLR
jgi:hypothetical protein